MCILSHLSSYALSFSLVFPKERKQKINCLTYLYIKSDSFDDNSFCFVKYMQIKWPFIYFLPIIYVSYYINKYTNLSPNPPPSLSLRKTTSLFPRPYVCLSSQPIPDCLCEASALSNSFFHDLFYEKYFHDICTTLKNFIRLNNSLNETFFVLSKHLVINVLLEISFFIHSYASSRNI